MVDRTVRFTEEFFERLDALRPDERSAGGIPSVADFLPFDLPPIRDKLANNLDEETLTTEEPNIRVYVGGGVLVAHIAVYVDEIDVDLVEAFWLSIER